MAVGGIAGGALTGEPEGLTGVAPSPAGYRRPKVLNHNLLLRDCSRAARWRDALKVLANMSPSYDSPALQGLL